MPLLVSMSVPHAEHVLARPEVRLVRVFVAWPGHLFAGGQDGLDQCGTLLRHAVPLALVLPQVEVLAAVDPRLFAAREERQGRAAPDHEIRLLAGLDGADVLINPQLPGRIERDELEGLLFGDA